MPVDSVTPHDIEELARPLSHRVFFAGEHTSSSHPAQVCGAVLSGLRAAGQVQFALGTGTDAAGGQMLSREWMEAAAVESAAATTSGKRRRSMHGGRSDASDSFSSCAHGLSGSAVSSG
jgi:hypothetical protein